MLILKAVSIQCQYWFPFFSIFNGTQPIVTLCWTICRSIGCIAALCTRIGGIGTLPQALLILLSNKKNWRSIVHKLLSHELLCYSSQPSLRQCTQPRGTKVTVILSLSKGISIFGLWPNGNSLLHFLIFLIYFIENVSASFHNQPLNCYKLKAYETLHCTKQEITLTVAPIL